MSRSQVSPWSLFSDFQHDVLAIHRDQDNVVFHYGDAPEQAHAEATLFTRAYFVANYFFYPRRVFVGDDSQIINSADQLQRADVVPSADWMRAHHVSSVAVFYGGSLIPHVKAIRVP